MKDVLTEIGVRSDELVGALVDLIAKMKTLPTDALGWPPTVPINDLTARVDALAGLCGDLSRTPADRFMLAPTSRVVALRDQLALLGESVRGLANNLANIPNWGGASRFDASAGVLHMHDGNTIGIAQLIGDLQTKFDAALEPYLMIASAVQPRGIGTLAAASRTVTEKAIEAEKLFAELEKSKLAWASHLERIEAGKQNFDALDTEAKRVLEEVEKVRKTVDENATKVGVAVTVTEELRAEATTLEATITSYQDKFNSFEKLLEKRQTALDSGNEALSQLTGELQKEKEKIVGLVSKAEEMLGGATTAGLASTYKGQADDVNGQLNTARSWYYVSIALLIASAAVALNLLGSVGIGLPIFPSFTADTPTGTIAVQALSALGSRGLLILPALLLAGFTSRRHAALFRLREEYSHKYTAAASVQGFKIQAPTYDESIAAAVFAELLKNPAQSLDQPKAQRSKNSFLDRIILPRVDAALTKAAELPTNTD
jgi:hypothetical protein